MKKHEGKFIPGHILDANYSPEGYFAFVAQLRSEMCCSHREAWEAANEALENHSLAARYTSYESYIVSRRVWVRDRMETKTKGYGRDKRLDRVGINSR
jgi:hypothetical protein